MAELTERERDSLPDSAFAYIDKDGGRHLPIPEESHILNAAARFDQTHFDSAMARRQAARAIVNAADRHGIDLSAHDHVVRAVGH